MKNNYWLDWLIRFVKGIFIGSGFIIPGVSGGVLAVVFGLYERMISFLSNIKKDFKQNFTFFLPIGLGGVFGVFLFSIFLNYFFEKAETELRWFLIGCIVGTLPALLKQASKKGRKPKHILIMIVTAMIFLFLLSINNTFSNVSIPLNFFTWIFTGAFIGLGSIVPGLSPSNFLVYINIYKPMTYGISNFDLLIIVPIGLGAIVTVLTLSKFMSFIFKKAYTTLFHGILGIVLASTIMIIPMPYDFSYLSISGLICVAACVLGINLGVWMSMLEEKYKPEYSYER